MPNLLTRYPREHILFTPPHTATLPYGWYTLPASLINCLTVEDLASHLNTTTLHDYVSGLAYFGSSPIELSTSRYGSPFIRTYTYCGGDPRTNPIQTRQPGSGVRRFRIFIGCTPVVWISR